MNSSDLEPKAITEVARALADDQLRAGKTLTLTLASSSMWPTLAPGDRLRVRAARPDDLRAGDILLRRLGATWVAHRLIRRQTSAAEMLLMTKGDNATTADAPWPVAQLLGVVVAVERRASPHAVPPTRARWLLVLLSRGQLLAARLEPALCRRMAIKLSRLCLRLIARLTW